ncbi:Daunorubicin/doxorubicin resistance ATP-binding protein DrrA [Streptomyces leeuwenhoekii]|uniref:Daunorubicin/doxorubicin resistance ATP-binding protein DrrA n=1 Tax=Streptomyces leeuwenhoekii TaxID=1437453 RepID=A0A0F7VKR9_STRLW|nr:Daunorubicin/doxorubicin resistance ATP-binding protein DrrA [Streptomyces leeuwenhoekii]
MTEVAYEIERLVKVYPRQTEAATNDVSLSVRAGEVFGILGDNGAGKTTLVRQMVNLLRSTSGEIRLFGRSVPGNPLFVSRTVAYMPQSSMALNRLKVKEAIYFAAHLRGMSRRDAARERDAMIETWQLGPVRDKSSSRLSGGQQRLLQLALATAGRLPVAVLDEPTNDLDPVNRKHVWEVLRKFNAEQGTTILFITHDAIEAERIVHRVGIMRKGSFLAIGQPAQLKRKLLDHMRLEVWLPPGEVPALPADMPQHWKSDDNVVLSVPRDRAPALLSELRLNESIDYRLYSATLEDLYLHYANSD